MISLWVVDSEVKIVVKAASKLDDYVNRAKLGLNEFHRCCIFCFLEFLYMFNVSE